MYCNGAEATEASIILKDFSKNSVYVYYKISRTFVQIVQ